MYNYIINYIYLFIYMYTFCMYVFIFILIFIFIYTDKNDTYMYVCLHNEYDGTDGNNDYVLNKFKAHIFYY